MNISVNLCPARKKEQEQVRDETTVNIELIFRNELEIPANPVRMLRHISARVDVPSLLLAFVYPRVSSRVQCVRVYASVASPVVVSFALLPVACKRLERPPFAQPFGLFAFPFAIHLV